MVVYRSGSMDSSMFSTMARMISFPTALSFIRKVNTKEMPTKFRQFESFVQCSPDSATEPPRHGENRGLFVYKLLESKTSAIFVWSSGFSLLTEGDALRDSSRLRGGLGAWLTTKAPRFWLRLCRPRFICGCIHPDMRRSIPTSLVLLSLGILVQPGSVSSQGSALGLFEAHGDIGAVGKPGSIEYDAV